MAGGRGVGNRQLSTGDAVPDLSPSASTRQSRWWDSNPLQPRYECGAGPDRHRHGATDGNRTRDLIRTKDALSQLSYGGVVPSVGVEPTSRASEAQCQLRWRRQMRCSALSYVPSDDAPRLLTAASHYALHSRLLTGSLAIALRDDGESNPASSAVPPLGIEPSGRGS